MAKPKAAKAAPMPPPEPVAPSRAGGRNALALLIIGGLSLAMTWRVTLAGRVMAPGDLLLIMEPWQHPARERFPEFRRPQNPILDGIQQFYPWRKFAGESLRRGLIPLWNPYVLSGNPFVANNQSAVFYPETWLHAVMSTDRALGWATALHFFTSGALMYWFLRVLRLHWPAALVGAVAFMFNGFVVGWLCFPSFRSVPAWLPGMLAAVELTARGGSRRWLALCALFVGLHFLAGNLHISLLVLITFGAYVLFRAAQVLRSDGRRAAGILAVGGAAAVLVGGGLAAGQLLPVVELAPLSARAGGLPYAEVLKLATPAPLLLTGLMPDVFGNPADYNHWGAELGAAYRAYTETTWYVGLAPWLLTGAAFLGRRKAQAWFWLGILLLGIALALGSPVYALFYHLVPGAKALSGLGRAILLSSTALCVLGALGLDTLLEWSYERGAAVRKYAGLSALLVAGVGAVGGALVWVRTGALEQALPGLGAYTSTQLLRFAILVALGAGVLALLPSRRRLAEIGLLAVLVVDLHLYVGKFTPAVPRDYLHVPSRTVDAIRSSAEPTRLLSLGRDPIRRMAPNTPMIVGLEDIQGSDSLEIGASRRLLTALSTERLGFLQPDPALPAIDLLGARHVHSGVDLGAVPGLSLLSSSEGWLYRNLDACPRAFTVGSWDAVASPDAALARVAAPDFTPLREAVFVADAAPSARPSHPGAPCAITYSGPHGTAVRGDFRAGDVLILADTYYPGWRAYQAGSEQPVLPADYSLRAVSIQQPGEQIDFVYLPASFRTGAFIALCTVGSLAAAGACAAGRRNTSGGR